MQSPEQMLALYVSTNHRYVETWHFFTFQFIILWQGCAWGHLVRDSKGWCISLKPRCQAATTPSSLDEKCECNMINIVEMLISFIWIAQTFGLQKGKMPNFYSGDWAVSISLAWKRYYFSTAVLPFSFLTQECVTQTFSDRLDSLDKEQRHILLWDLQQHFSVWDVIIKTLLRFCRLFMI